MNNELVTQHNEKLLNSIYKNAQMALSAIEDIISAITDANLRELILKQKGVYEDVSGTCESISKKYNLELKDLNMFLKATSFVSIKTKAIMNKTTSNHAEMLIQGTTMGITDIITETSNNSLADHSIIALANKIRNSEEVFVESLKGFLKK